MRAVPTSFIEDGSILGENLYTYDGHILVKAQTKLSRKLIEKIEKNKIYTVYIQCQHSDFETKRLLEQSFRVKGASLVKIYFFTCKGRQINFRIVQ